MMRFLRGIPDTFLAVEYRCHVRPNILERNAGHLIKVSLVVGHARFHVDQPALLRELPHPLLGVCPIAPFVGWHTLVFTTLVRLPPFIIEVCFPITGCWAFHAPLVLQVSLNAAPAACEPMGAS